MMKKADILKKGLQVFYLGGIGSMANLCSGKLFHGFIRYIDTNLLTLGNPEYKFTIRVVNRMNFAWPGGFLVRP
jgi:hypothetical protein